MSPAPRPTIFVDCDTGVDDAVALLYLLADPGIEVCGISTVFGNVSAAAAAQNTLWVLDVAGRAGSIPVARGCEASLVGERPERATRVHGANGLGGVEIGVPTGKLSPLSGPELIVRTARERPGEVHILATAPLTNLAVALRTEPELPNLIAGVTIMGGAALAPGNVTPAAEANIWHDPEAAQAVLSAPWPTTLVPLDVTMREVMTEEQLAVLASAEAAPARFAARILASYFDYYSNIYGRKACACHDVLAAGIAAGDVVPRLAMTVGVTVETGSGAARGATICDLRGRYRGEHRQAGATCTVVLETVGDFSAAVVERLASPPELQDGREER
ncbi:MAG TPA: nucleoside hydrolase [Acidimicrobiales bacterium]|nr:nucleoside hydrolase [Acidimicrobiales bacterium]